MGLEKISLLKKEMGLTNAQLSELSGVPLSTLDKITAGITTDPKLETVKALCYALGCTLDDLDDNSKAKIKRNEYILIEKYNSLDERGKKAIDQLLHIEYEESIKHNEVNCEPEPEEKIRYIDFYHLPVSAGTGVYLDGEYKEMLEVPLNCNTAKADYILKVSGDSMEPQFQNGDIILIKSQPAVEVGELGIFIINNDGYFKKWGGDRLLSLNNSYEDIIIGEFDYLSCKGKVIGKL